MAAWAAENAVRGRTHSYTP